LSGNWNECKPLFYGPLNEEGYGANLRLLNRCIHQPGVERARIQIMMKIGVDTRSAGLTLVHFSAQPEPFLTQNAPLTPPNPHTAP